MYLSCPDVTIFSPGYKCRLPFLCCSWKTRNQSLIYPGVCWSFQELFHSFLFLPWPTLAEETQEPLFPFCLHPLLLSDSTSLLAQHFSNSALLFSEAKSFFVAGGSPVHCGAFSSIPGFYSLFTRNRLSDWKDQKCLQRLLNVLWLAKLPPISPPHEVVIFLKNIFIYFFIFGCVGSVLLGGLFFSGSKWGLFSRCSTQASHCGGFSCCWAWAPGHAGSSGWVTWA